ncbi:uncharacterized protein METZ01_LOCUS491689, partial [marine metagenome]
NSRCGMVLVKKVPSKFIPSPLN